MVPQVMKDFIISPVVDADLGWLPEGVNLRCSLGVSA
jgi:hypothetical protein